MEKLLKYNFKLIGEDTKTTLISINKHLNPHLMRYIETGLYHILVENTFIKNDKRFLLVEFGGSEDYSFENNYNTYIALNDRSIYYTLQESLIKACK